MPDTLTQDSTARSADGWAPAFVCSWSDGGLDAAWVDVRGELDMATAPQLEQTLGDPRLQARLVVLDLRELTFIDGVGVHAVVNASLRARQAGRRLIVLRGIPKVDRVFTLAASAEDLEIGEIGAPELPIGALRLASEQVLAS